MNKRIHVLLTAGMCLSVLSGCGRTDTTAEYHGTTTRTTSITAATTEISQTARRTETTAEKTSGKTTTTTLNDSAAEAETENTTHEGLAEKADRALETAESIVTSLLTKATEEVHPLD